jgi:hypothetical protein
MSPNAPQNGRKKRGFAGDASICLGFKPSTRHIETIHKYQEKKRTVYVRRRRLVAGTSVLYVDFLIYLPFSLPEQHQIVFLAYVFEAFLQHSNPHKK